MTLKLKEFALSEDGYWTETTARKLFAYIPIKLSNGSYIFWDSFYLVCDLKEPYNFMDGPSFTKYTRLNESEFKSLKGS